MLLQDENSSRPVNLEKIFTPAEDAPQILPGKSKSEQNELGKV